MYRHHRFLKSPFLRNKKSQEEVQLLPEIGLARKHTGSIGGDTTLVKIKHHFISKYIILLILLFYNAYMDICALSLHKHHNEGASKHKKYWEKELLHCVPVKDIARWPWSIFPLGRTSSPHRWQCWTNLFSSSVFHVHIWNQRITNTLSCTK